MKQYVAALACAAAMCASAQTSPIPAPADWRAESFIFPLQFAPSIPYEGVEYVRFTPTWQRFDSDGGFSYVFLWDVKTRPVTPEDLEDYLEAYFTGLMKNVGVKRELSDKEVKTVAAVHPMAALASWEQGYGIEVRTWNAFSKGEALLLHGEVGQRNCGERMQIFFALSRSPRDRPIWDRLREARNATTCRV
ncbi:MAG TPA: hypothetical protein VF348_08040 [Usitatibacter sp.]